MALGDEKKFKPMENVVSDILMDRPYFNSIKFLDTARLQMISMYRSLKDNNYTFIENFCTKEFVVTLKNKKKELFNLNDDVDFLSVQSRTIRDYRRNSDYDEIDVFFHTFYVDYMNNNVENYHPARKKYLEIVYRVTFKAPSYMIVSENNNKCDRCGASMKKNPGRHIFSCEYCGNNKVIEYAEWKIDNVEVYK